MEAPTDKRKVANLVAADILAAFSQKYVIDSMTFIDNETREESEVDGETIREELTAISKELRVASGMPDAGGTIETD